MKKLTAIVVFIALLSSCDDKNFVQKDEVRQKNGVFSCGIDTTNIEVDRLFEKLMQLEEIIENGQSENDPINYPFLFIDGDVVQEFDKQKLKDNVKDIFTRHAFEIIKGYQTKDLYPAGWRGCYISHGKLSFKVYTKNGPIFISSFNKSIPWS